MSAEKAKTPKALPVKVAAAVNPVKPVMPKAAPVVAAKPAAVGKVVNKTVNAPVAKSFVKPVVKPAAKPVTKLVTKSAIKPAAPTKLISVVAKEKIKKEKLVRDSFTMPESEYAALGLVKKACIGAGVEVKKSQLLRIGLLLLSRTDVNSLKTLIANLAPLKAGRPKKDK
ncbi:MAG: hypothetical protein Q7R66_03600 [Undibacterium sp.]|nr:hypothetical protein [Undibacterium sp.]